MWTHRFIILFNILLSITIGIYFGVELSQIWPVEAPSSFLSCPFNISCHSLSTFFLCVKRYFRLIFSFLSSILESAILQEALVPFSGEKVWKARSRHYICSLQLGYHCSQILLIDRTRKHMYIHTHTHPLYSFIYICWKPGVCSDTYNSNLPPQVHFRFSSFHIAATFVRKVIQNHPHLGFLSEFLGVKNPPANAGDMDSILGSGRCPGEGDGNLLQCSGLGNPVHRGAWQATVSGVTKICTFMSMNPRLHSVHLLICSIFLHVNDFLTLLYASLSCATYNPRLRLPSPLWLTALFGPI